MKKIIFILTTAVIISSCGNTTKENKSEKNQTDTASAQTTSNTGQNITIKDKSQYDQSFIDELSKLQLSLKLVDNTIVVGKDSAKFPEDLPLNQKIVFKGKKNNQSFQLSATRTNYTGLNYEFTLIQNNKVIYNKSGRAVLNPMFYLEPENDYDTDNTDYGCYEYWDRSNDCWFSARIGIDSDSNGKKRAKVSFGCEDKNKPQLALEQCPVLRSE